MNENIYHKECFQNINISRHQEYFRCEDMEKDLVKMFFREKPVKILTSLKNGPKYATIVAKEIDCTYSHTIKLLDSFRDLGLVEFDKKGRIKVITLTEDGMELAHAIEGVLLKLSRIKEKLEEKESS